MTEDKYLVIRGSCYVPHLIGFNKANSQRSLSCILEKAYSIDGIRLVRVRKYD